MAHTIATTRMRSCPTTRAYVARRTAEGKNPREIRRCLKRYIARQLYRTLARASVEPRRGRATASGTLCVSQPEGGKKRPSQPTVALGTLLAADPAA
jgi:hypothetical protein